MQTIGPRSLQLPKSFRRRCFLEALKNVKKRKVHKRPKRQGLKKVRAKNVKLHNR